MPLWAQKPIFERRPALSALSPVVSWSRSDGSFLADDFKAGTNGEMYHIDAVRIWIVSTVQLDNPTELGTVFSKITLLGGIADNDFSKDAKAPNCDCRGVIPLHSDLKVSALPVNATFAKKRVYQLDFTNLKWSVPGGLVQIGIQPTVQPKAATSQPWSIVAQSGDAFHLRIFDKEGRLISPFDFHNQPPRRIAIQVWAH
jgi:hypothetical protein